MKYKKRPVIIEAVQWNGRNFKEVRELGDGVGMGVDNYRNKQMFITTLEGNMMASVGDFIIKGVNGELYPCKPDIFMKTYEEVAE